MQNQKKSMLIIVINGIPTYVLKPKAIKFNYSSPLFQEKQRKKNIQTYTNTYTNTQKCQ